LADSKGTKSLLEAAHVIAARAPKAVLERTPLLNVFDTNNGVTLCCDCHHWYDRFMWCVRPDGTVAVADALRLRAGCERWADLAGKALRAPTDPPLLAAWPPPRHWAVQECLFEAAAAARHEIVAGHLLACEMCDARFDTARKLKGHKCALGQHVFTPIFVRAFPQVAAAAAAASDGERRVLDFGVTEEESGESSDA
jgi:hypothetical protein